MRPKRDDSTDAAFEELRGLAGCADLEARMHLLRRADAGGRLRTDGLLEELRGVLGEEGASELIGAFAKDACRYCRHGRETCEDCGGRGHYDNMHVCSPCAGLGLKRCPFCNGTGLAGFEFVPRGLRAAVLAARVGEAEHRLSKLALEPPSGASPRDVARIIVELDRGRGVLADAVEQVRVDHNARQGAAGEQASAPNPSATTQVETRCRRDNLAAEAALRRALDMYARHYAERAKDAASNGRTPLYANRARAFARLGRSRHFEETALETPRSLRAD